MGAFAGACGKPQHLCPSSEIHRISGIRASYGGPSGGRRDALGSAEAKVTERDPVGSPLDRILGLLSYVYGQAW